MKIQVTNSNAYELLKIIKLFPNGRIICVNEQVYWESEDKIPEMPQIQQNKQQNKGDFFTGMRDSLFSAFGA